MRAKMNEQQIDVLQEPREQAIDVNGEPNVIHGIDGVSPIATVEQTETGATISITDRNGTTTADIFNGVNGKDGKDGIDGVSATISVGNVSTGNAGTDVVITNSGTSRDAILNFTIPRGDTGASGKDGKDGINGADGQNGTNGQDGFSPIATVSKVDDTATISITDKNGTTTATVKDGTDATITIDDALSPTSGNPVKNSTIYNAIGNIESILATLNNGGGAQ